MVKADRIRIPGSERRFERGHGRVGGVDYDEIVGVTVYLRRRASLDWVQAEADRSAADRCHKRREDWSTEYGADPSDVRVLRRFAACYKLNIDEVSLARRAVRMTGPLRSIKTAFGAGELATFTDAEDRPYRARQGALSLPTALAEIVEGVFGVDNRPQARTFLHATDAAGTGYTPCQVASAYDFPRAFDGAGQTVGVIDLGGGFKSSELSEYFAEFGISMPRVVSVGVDGGPATPGGEAGREVMVDLEILGAIAPRADLVVYSAPGPDDQSFINAVSYAVHDAVHRPAVVSITWGAPEELWTHQARAQMEQALLEATALGVTVIVASGDSGSAGGLDDGRQHVAFPAAAPHALACGGTSLDLREDRVEGETVWNNGVGFGATGGGVSVEFELPAYQAGASVPPHVDTSASGRGVPDVAGHADSHSGYRVLFDGAWRNVGGTSAATPLWAALITLLNQSLASPIGFLQPHIYKLPTATFNSIVTGDNGAYQAGPGWDACTGLGSPRGTALMQALTGTPTPPSEQTSTPRRVRTMTASLQHAELTIPVSAVGTMVAEQLASTIAEDSRARGLLDNLAALVPETSPDSDEPHPLCVLVIARTPMDRMNGHAHNGGLIRPFLDAVDKQEAPDGGTLAPTAPPPTPASPGTTDAGATDAGTGAGGAHEETSYWHILYEGPKVDWWHDEDGWHITFGSGHLSGTAGGKPKKP